VVGQLTEKVVQWTESNVTASYFIKEIQAESDRLDRLQGKAKHTLFPVFQFIVSCGSR
jgi:hypothetical protein